MPEPGWKLTVLGVVQDAGMPHLACRKPPCTDVRAGKRKPEKVSCIGIRDEETGASYIFDATPDFREQLHALNGGEAPDGIFLTHAHIGHYTGLMYLGKESINAIEVPVYCTRKMAEFLTSNGPWSLLVKNKNIVLRVVEPDKPVDLPGGMRVTPFLVPHREEFTDTVGYMIEGPRKRVVFIPDIDRWEKWDRSVRDLADEVDLLFLDGSFSSPAEIGSRDITQIPHPMMPHTRELLRGTRGELWFIHLNHTNPALCGGKDVAREGMEFDL